MGSYPNDDNKRCTFYAIYVDVEKNLNKLYTIDNWSTEELLTYLTAYTTNEMITFFQVSKDSWKKKKEQGNVVKA